MTRLLLSFTLVALALLTGLGSCTPTDEQIAPAPEVKPALPASLNTEQIALLVPFESDVPEWDVLATNLENGAKLAMGDLGISQHRVKVYATGGNRRQAEQAMLAALDDGADVVLGPAFSFTTRAVASLPEARDVPIFSFSNDLEVAGGNVTILGQSFENLADRLVSHAVQNNMKTAVVVSENTRSGVAARNALLAAADRHGQIIADVVNHEFSQMGIVGAIGQVEASVHEHFPNIIYFTSNSAGALPVITRLLDDRQLRDDGILYAGISRWDIPGAALKLSAFQGALFPLPDPVLINRFSTRYEERYGTLPHPFASLGYDGVALVHALSTNRRLADRHRARKVIAVRGSTGELRLLPDGSTTRYLVIGTIVDEQLEIVRDLPISMATITLHGAGMHSKRAF